MTWTETERWTGGGHGAAAGEWMGGDEGGETVLGM